MVPEPCTERTSPLSRSLAMAERTTERETWNC